MTGETVKNHDQALGVQDGLPDPLGDLTEALAGCSSEPAFRTLDRALQFIARILKSTYRWFFATMRCWRTLSTSIRRTRTGDPCAGADLRDPMRKRLHARSSRG